MPRSVEHSVLPLCIQNITRLFGLIFRNSRCERHLQETSK